jgi:nitrate reductase gamma subunit
MTPIALLSAQPAAAVPVTGADLVLYVVVAAIVGVTGLLVRRATARDHVSTTSMSASTTSMPASKKLQ